MGAYRLVINLIQILGVVWHTQVVNDYRSIAATIAKSATRARTAQGALLPQWQSLPPHTIAKHIKIIGMALGQCAPIQGPML